MKTQPTAVFMTVTPTQAKKWLEQNTSNRPVNESNLASLIYDMNRKNFHLTGEPIKFDEEGVLLDGQHRLMAIAKSGEAIRMLVVHGLDRAAFKYLDTGRKRQASDVLAIEKYSSPAKIAAMVKFIIGFQKGQWSVASSYSGGKGRPHQRAYNSDISNFVAENKESIYDSFPYGFTSKNRVASPAYVSGLHFILKSKDEVLADEFFHKLVTGEDLNAKSPIYLLRQKLINDIRATRKMKSIEKLALICKAWNLCRSKKTVTSLTWVQMKEAFPKPI